ncbi:MAG: STAS domain-containing protein [Janthinobacterium lividum]
MGTRQQLEVEVETSSDSKRYRLRGSLFFASATKFTRFFTPKEDPAHVYLEFDHARIMDSSALEAVEMLAERYRALGKILHIHGLSENCDKLLRRKGGNVTITPSKGVTAARVG